MKHTIFLLIGFSWLAGCQATSYHYTQKLQQAHWALQSGRIEQAQKLLAEASSIASDKEITETVEAPLLQAELLLAKGDLEEALATIKSVQSRPDVDSLDTARVEEILGKIALRQGNFKEAQEHLLIAEKSYPQQKDQLRVADLVILVRGLTAYGKGDLKVAQRYWQSISNVEMRHAIDQVVQDTKNVADNR